MGWNYLSIPKLQQLQLDKQFYPTLHHGCNYISMLEVNIIIESVLRGQLYGFSGFIFIVLGHTWPIKIIDAFYAKLLKALEFFFWIFGLFCPFHDIPWKLLPIKFPKSWQEELSTHMKYVIKYDPIWFLASFLYMGYSSGWLLQELSDFQYFHTHRISLELLLKI